MNIVMHEGKSERLLNKNFKELHLSCEAMGLLRMCAAPKGTGALQQIDVIKRKTD